MSEDELLKTIEEFDTSAEIKNFFEQNCQQRASKPLNSHVLDTINKQEFKTYTRTILSKDIIGINNPSYHNKTPLEIINSEEDMDNALKVIINNPEFLLEDYSKTKLSFTLIKDKEGNNQYFLNSDGNHRVIILLVLSDICEELQLEDMEVIEYK